jgi:DNA-binding transcriptional regulator YdaS (Cro superfamily)
VTASSGGPGVRVQAAGAAIGALTAAPAVAQALAQAPTLPALRAALDAAGAADRTRRLAALVLTVDDLAVWCGVGPGTANGWRGMPGFPAPVPAGTGGPAWWWPAIRDFIVASAAALAGDIPLLGEPVPAPPPGRRGPRPRMWVRTGFDLRLISVMHARKDQHGRAALTRPQIAASLLYPLPPGALSKHLPRGRGGDLKTLPDPEIARMRELRALRDSGGKPLYSLAELAGLFGVSDITVSRYCRDLAPGPPPARAPGIMITTAAGGTLAPEQVRQVAIMWAERNPDGSRRHTREQVAAHFGITPQDVTAIYRHRHLRRTAPPPGPAEEPARPGTPQIST